MSRFLYRTADGQEVEVEDLQELATRIESGEVGPATLLYDASTDRWSKAADLPLFHFLVEEQGGGEGLEEVLPGSHGEPAGDRATEAPAGGEAADARPEPAGVGEEGGPDEGPDPPGEIEEPLDPLLLDLTMVHEDAPAPGPGGDPEGPPGSEVSPRAGPPSEASPESEVSPESETPPEDQASPERGDEPDARPLRPFGGGEWEAPEDPARDAAGSVPDETPVARADDPASRSPDEDRPAGDLEKGRTGGRRADEPPTRHPPAGRELDLIPFGDDPGRASGPGSGRVKSPADGPGSAGGGRAGEPGAPESGEGPRARPGLGSSPGVRSRRRGTRRWPIPVLAGLLAVVAGGTWALAWGPWGERELPWVGGGEEGGLPEQELGAVGAEGTGSEPRLPSAEDVAPDLQDPAADLRPVVARELSELLTALREDHGLDLAPSREWLSGRYFSSASAFPEIRRYWVRYSSFLADVREEEDRFFAEALEAGLGVVAVPADDGERLREELMAAFRDGTEARGQRYDELEELADAAVALHDLLVSREADIRYTPAFGAAVSEDPVLEAVPADPDLRREINGHLDRMLHALDRSQGVRPVSTPLLMDALFERLFGR